MTDHARVERMIAAALARRARLPAGAHATARGTGAIVAAALGIDPDRVSVATPTPAVLAVRVQGQVAESAATLEAFAREYRRLLVPAWIAFALEVS